jgi:hypothetical protein
MQGASKEPSGLAHGFGEPLVLLLWACCFSPGFRGLEVVDVMIFGEQHEWSITQVARMCASSVPPLGVLYVLWCFRCGLLFFRVLSSFPITN